MTYNAITAAYEMPYTERNAHNWEIIRRYNVHDELVAIALDLRDRLAVTHNGCDLDQAEDCDADQYGDGNAEEHAHLQTIIALVG